MKPTATELAIEHINKQIDTLEAAKQHILNAHEAIGRQTNGEAEAPKKRGRKRKTGLPSAVPPASEANHRQDDRL